MGRFYNIFYPVSSCNLQGIITLLCFSTNFYRVLWSAVARHWWGGWGMGSGGMLTFIELATYVMRDHWTCSLRDAGSNRWKKHNWVYPDGNVAWETMAAERGFEVEAVSHQRKQFTRKIVQRKSTSPSLAGTQIIDRAWRSLKNDWWPQLVNATSKVGGHTMMSDDIKSMVHHWVWRQSLGPATPLRLLEELKRLLKHWWKNAVKCRFAVVWKRSKTRKRKKTMSFFY